MRSFEEWAKEEHYDEIFRWWKRWKKGRQKPEPRKLSPEEREEIRKGVELAQTKAAREMFGKPEPKPASPDEPRWVG